MLATGGFGRMFRITSNAFSLTGDGVALAYRHGVPMEDMEFYQFHPTGIVGIGILLSEAARGEGGILLNDLGERFMERYAPTMKDLAPRDMVSRVDLPGDPGGARHRRQGLRPPRRPPPRPQGHRGEAARHHRLRPRLPGRRADHRAGADPADRPLRDGRHPDRHRRPSHPRRGQHGRARPVCGGRGACVSVHGANRLGTNSLVDLLVFGRRAGRQMAADVAGDRPAGPAGRPPRSPSAPSSRRSAAGSTARAPARIRQELADVMMDEFGVYRDEALLTGALGKVRELRERYAQVGVQDKGASSTRTCWRHASSATCSIVPRRPSAAALARKESRGGPRPRGLSRSGTTRSC